MKSLKERIVENYKELGTPKGMLMSGGLGGMYGYLIAKRTGNKQLGIKIGAAYALSLPAMKAVNSYLMDKMMGAYDDDPQQP